MSNKYDDINEKKMGEITQMIKVLTESMKTHLSKIKNDGGTLEQDTSIMALQILSILCGINRGYSNTKLNSLWANSLKTAEKINTVNKDKVTSDFTNYVYENRNKN